MSSILTNNGAMVALQTLRMTNNNMSDVQSQIATGKKVATAKDNASSWSIASTMDSDVKTFNKVSENLTSASALIGTARKAAEMVGEKVKMIQEKMVQAGQPGADTAKIGAEVTALTASITSIAQTAQYNGVNLVKATPDTATITASVTRDGTGALTAQTFAVAGVDLEAVATAINALAVDGSTASLDGVDAQLDAVNAAAAGFGAAQVRIESQNEFLAAQADALKTGIGALVDADMEEASARLQALQVQQQLGIQALSMANQAPQSVLSLFR